MAGHAPVGSVDRTVLLSIEARLDTAPSVRSTRISLKRGKPTLTATFVRDYFPPDVEDAYHDVRWYTSGDFELHYRENWRSGGGRQRRWDRHPRDGDRTHYHPLPDAGSPPEPVDLPEHYYDVLGHVDERTLDHVRDQPRFDTG